ncbi:LOW QUALITY PROTEIN: hypothetical protein KUTeg_007099 [Tegillarca granosa]|uniref:Major facilitator superfamily (MFS) profile domain-containing protein n=1 Tax=Tegillarca granosa TaxID=220873 RepID=A0ABQ9FC99_TEGGR|nr:LOW QUALITY PROTEIN: hypothetical protein KUTeg_007099 [Tegillarca granosa]
MPAILGDFGPYQIRVFVFANLPLIFFGFQLFSTLFIFGEQTRRCSLEGTKWATVNNNSENFINSTYHFNLVCDRKIDITHATMGFFGGCLTAAVVMGTLGDIIGRKPTACFCNAVTFFASLALTWAPNITVFSILRFLIGMGVFGYFTQSFIIGLELVGPSKRIYTGLIIELVFCLGELILLALAYFIRDWQTLQLVLTAPSVILLFYWFLLPESARWLLSKGKTKEALKIIEKIAKENKKEFKPESFELETNEEETVGFKDSILPVLRSRPLVCAVTYYGITYNVGRIGGSVYVNYLISVIVEAIGYSSVLFLSNYFGRKKVHCGTYFWIMILLSNIGKCCVSAGFGNIYLFTTELFPTNVRSFVLGTVNIGARMGTIVAPYIANITDIVHTEFGLALPLIIFGCIALTVGIASLIIPETLNTKLPETIEDALQMKRYKETTIVNGENKNFIGIDDGQDGSTC